MENSLDTIAILIAGLVNFLIGLAWYSPWLFGPIWKKLAGFDKGHPYRRRKIAPLWAFLLSLLTAYVLDFFVVFLGVTTVSDGMFVGFLVWFGFIATVLLSAVIWSHKSFKFFLIDGGYRLLGMLVMGGILGA